MPLAHSSPPAPLACCPPLSACCLSQAPLPAEPALDLPAARLPPLVVPARAHVPVGHLPALPSRPAAPHHPFRHRALPSAPLLPHLLAGPGPARLRHALPHGAQAHRVQPRTRRQVRRRRRTSGGALRRRLHPVLVRLSSGVTCSVIPPAQPTQTDTYFILPPPSTFHGLHPAPLPHHSKPSGPASHGHPHLPRPTH